MNAAVQKLTKSVFYTSKFDVFLPNTVHYFYHFIFGIESYFAKLCKFGYDKPHYNVVK